MTWGGFLSWQSSTRDADGYDQLKERIEAYEAMNYSIRRLEPPDFAAFPGNFDLAAYTTFSGHVDAALATNVFLEGARARGALVVYPCEVNEIVLEQGRLRHVATSCGRFPLDRLVIAAGVGTPSLAALVGLNVPLVHSPGILAQSLPMEAMLRRLHTRRGSISNRPGTEGW